MNKMKVAILGAGGYVAEEMIRMLLGHPDVEICSLLSESGKEPEADIGDIFPRFRKQIQQSVVNKPDSKLWSCDIAFVSKPNNQAMHWVPQLLKHGLRVIDLCAVYRFRNAKIYEEIYNEPHESPQLAKEAIYGLTEVYRESIRTAKLVANPGCYATSVILGCAPLSKQGIGNPTDIIVDSYSGISGAGKMPSNSNGMSYNFVERDENIMAYSVLQHRHAPEMEQELGALAKKDVRVSFVPHLVPLRQGIMSTIHIALNEGERITLSDLHDIYTNAYTEEPFVRVMKKGEAPDLRSVERTNFCDIGLFYNERLKRIVIMSAIDNLGKGAAGQAIQNMNVMCGFEETAALLQGNLIARASTMQTDPNRYSAPVFSTSQR